MFKPDRAEQFADRLREILENSPAKDIEKNCRAFANAMLGKMNVVTREEFEEQSRILGEAITKLNAIEERLRELAPGAGESQPPRKRGRTRKAEADAPPEDGQPSGD